jgi:hypothetical protein
VCAFVVLRRTFADSTALGTPKEPVSDSTRRAAGAALQTRIEALKEQAQALNSMLEEIERVVDGVARVLKSGKTA